MCGIYGIWHTDGRQVDLLALRRAVTSMRHRGPDDWGVFTEGGTGEQVQRDNPLRNIFGRVDAYLPLIGSDASGAE